MNYVCKVSGGHRSIYFFIFTTRFCQHDKNSKTYQTSSHLKSVDFLRGIFSRCLMCSSLLLPTSFLKLSLNVDCSPHAIRDRGSCLTVFIIALNSVSDGPSVILAAVRTASSGSTRELAPRTTSWPSSRIRNGSPSSRCPPGLALRRFCECLSSWFCFSECFRL